MKKVRKFFKVSGIVLLIIIGLVWATLFFINQNLQTIALKHLNEYMIKSGLNEVYTVDLEKARINLFSRKITLKGLSIKPVESFFSADDSLRLKYPVVYAIEIPSFRIRGMKNNFSFDLQEIHLRSIELNNPSITMIDHLTKKEKQRVKKPEKKPADADFVDKVLPHFMLDELRFEDGKFTYFDNIYNRDVFSLGPIDINISNLNLDLQQMDFASIRESFGDAGINLKNIQYATPDGFYTVKLQDMSIMPEENRIIIEQFRLIPRYNKKDFGKKFGKQTDRMDLTVAYLEIADLDLMRLVYDDELWISTITVDGVNFDIFRDKNIERDLSIFPKLPHQALADMEMGLNIEKIHITNANIYYQELEVGSITAGQATLTDVTAVMTHISNIPEVQNAVGAMQWDMHGNLFGTGKFEIHVDFSDPNADGSFSFNGEIGAMDMTVFNQFIEPNLNLSIAKGKKILMLFDIDCNADYAGGEMIFLYDSLKINLLKVTKDDEQKRKGILSSLATQAIKLFNLDHREDYDATVNIFFIRDKNKGIFNYMVKSILDGVIASVTPGKNPPAEEQWAKHLEKEEKQEERELKQQERQEEKQTRQQMREERRREREKRKNNPDE